MEILIIITLILFDIVLLQRIVDHVRTVRRTKEELKTADVYEMPPSIFRGY